MKVTLYYVDNDNWLDYELEGIYTEKEFANLEEKIIEKYRESDEYIDDVKGFVDDSLAYEAALGFENAVEEFKRMVDTLEVGVLERFIEDYVREYEKEV